MQHRAVRYDVEVVLYEGGAFAQLTTSDWIEAHSEGTFAFTLVGRSETTVELAEGGPDGSGVLLDLEAMQVMVRDEFGDWVGLRELTSVRPERINGWSATRATLDGFGYTQISADTWIEYSFDGPRVLSQELRDEWSVYFGGNVHLDFYDMTRADSGDVAPLTDPQPERIGAFFVREILVDGGGRFVQTGPATWEERAGDDIRVYEEVRPRDVWTLYLDEVGESVRLIVNLSTLTVERSVGGGEREPLHDIVHLR